MGTTTIEARCNARPTRLAFIIPKPDRDLLIGVISRATSLWGGMFNPIVILDDSTRAARGVYHDRFPPQESYIQRQDDILRSFDPDILINYSDDPLPEALKHFQHRTYPAARLDWNPWGRREMSYFVDVYPVLDELWDREFKGNQSPRVKLRFLEKAASKASLFLAARYGLYSNDGAYNFLTIPSRVSLAAAWKKYRSGAGRSVMKYIAFGCVPMPTVNLFAGALTIGLSKCQDAMQLSC